MSRFSWFTVYNSTFDIVLFYSAENTVIDSTCPGGPVVLPSYLDKSSHQSITQPTALSTESLHCRRR